MLIELKVEQKRIYSEVDSVSMVSDNGDYRVHFTFDDEWNGLIKTARFINGREYSDVILDDSDCALIPEHLLKPGMLSVGVYASGLRTTAPYVIRCDLSILSPNGVPSDPPADIYSQLLSICEETNNKVAKSNELYEEILNEYKTACNLAESYSEAEGERISSENERSVSEAARIDAEGVRAANESARVSDEQIRCENESARTVAEADRINAENLRVSAEAERRSAESERVKNARGFEGAYRNLVGQGEKYSNPYVMSKRGVGEVAVDECITPCALSSCTVYGSMSEENAENKGWDAPSDISFFSPTSFTVSGVTHTVQDGIVLREFNGVRDEYDAVTGKIIRRVGGTVFTKNGDGVYMMSDINGFFETPLVMEVYVHGRYAKTNCVRFEKQNFYMIDSDGKCTSDRLIYTASTLNKNSAVSGMVYINIDGMIYITYNDQPQMTANVTMEIFKQKVSELEQAGTPLVIYYRYSEPIEEYTEPIRIPITENGDAAVSDDGVELKISYKTDVNKIHPLYGKSICVFGGKTERLGDLATLLQTDKNMTVYDRTEDGAVFITGTVADQITENISGDYLVFTGGIGDILSTVGAVMSGYDTAPDTSSAAGGFEAVCKALVESYHGKKLGFIFPHRYAEDISELKSVFVTVLEKWGIPYLDLSVILPPLGVIESLREEYTDADGIVPNDKCLSELYLPKVSAWLSSL